MPLQCRYPEPDEFKVDATYTSRFSYTKVGIHSKYTEHIRRYKYRQGYRLTGAHLRVARIITHPPALANQNARKTPRSKKSDAQANKEKAVLYCFFNVFHYGVQ